MKSLKKTRTTGYFSPRKQKTIKTPNCKTQNKRKIDGSAQILTEYAQNYGQTQPPSFRETNCVNSKENTEEYRKIPMNKAKEKLKKLSGELFE